MPASVADDGRPAAPRTASSLRHQGGGEEGVDEGRRHGSRADERGSARHQGGGEEGADGGRPHGSRAEERGGARRGEERGVLGRGDEGGSEQGQAQAAEISGGGSAGMTAKGYPISPGGDWPGYVGRVSHIRGGKKSAGKHF